MPSRGPLVAVEEPKAEGSIPSWRYLGIVWGNSPGCFISYQCPAHVDVGSSGGPHHGDRSSQIYSPNAAMKTPATPRKASKIRNAIIQPRIVGVTGKTVVTIIGLVAGILGAFFALMQAQGWHFKKTPPGTQPPGGVSAC